MQSTFTKREGKRELERIIIKEGQREESQAEREKEKQRDI